MNRGKKEFVLSKNVIEYANIGKGINNRNKTAKNIPTAMPLF